MIMRSDIKKSWLTMLAFVPAWFLVGCGISDRQFPQERKQVISFTNGSSGVIVAAPIANVFVDPTRFRDTQALPPFRYDGIPLAGVVNHHTLAIDIQARFFKTLKSVRPDIRTFIILSPDHFRRGQDISINKLPYATPSGLLTFNFQLESVGETWDGTASRSFTEEHGVGALAPFIARDFPESEILPIFLRADAPREKLVALGEVIADISSSSTFVIISSDMSHGLSDAEALRNDRETSSWLLEGKWNELEDATDIHTDSAPAFMVLHEYFSRSKEPHQKVEFELIAHALSTAYGGDPDNATSYIVGFWK